MWEFLVDFVFPCRCVSCGSFGSFLCQNCEGKIDYFRYQVCPYCQGPSLSGFTHERCKKRFGIDGLFVLGHYRGPLKKLVKKVKYQKVWRSIAEISKIILKYYPDEFKFNFLVPVPLSQKREAERGFNQAEILAHELQKIFSRPVFTADILKRTRHTKPQFELTYKDRQKNLVDAFSLKDIVAVERLENQSFCLVDDVATTGSTLFESAKVLKKAGAAKVFAITIARGG